MATKINKNINVSSVSDPEPDPDSGGLLDSESGSGSRGLKKDQKC